MVRNLQDTIVVLAQLVASAGSCGFTINRLCRYRVNAIPSASRYYGLQRAALVIIAASKVYQLSDYLDLYAPSASRYTNVNNMLSTLAIALTAVLIKEAKRANKELVQPGSADRKNAYASQEVLYLLSICVSTLIICLSSVMMIASGLNDNNSITSGITLRGSYLRA